MSPEAPRQSSELYNAVLKCRCSPSLLYILVSKNTLSFKVVLSNSSPGFLRVIQFFFEHLRRKTTSGLSLSFMLEEVIGECQVTQPTSKPISLSGQMSGNEDESHKYTTEIFERSPERLKNDH